MAGGKAYQDQVQVADKVRLEPVAVPAGATVTGVEMSASPTNEPLVNSPSGPQKVARIGDAESLLFIQMFS